MIDVDQRTIELRQEGFMKGVRPVIIDIIKGGYPYKGKYVMCYAEDCIYFYQLDGGYRYRPHKAVNFMITYESLIGYRFAFEKAEQKQ